MFTNGTSAAIANKDVLNFRIMISPFLLKPKLWGGQSWPQAAF
jgi:hypothetical protein